MILSNKVKFQTNSKMTVRIEDADYRDNVKDKLTHQKFSVQYNPETFAYTRNSLLCGSIYHNRPSDLDNIDRRNITINLTFDAATGGVVNVKQLTQPFEMLALPLIKPSTAIKGRPPYITLTWADDCIKGFIKSFTQQFTLFAPNGTPKRAKVELVFQEYISQEKQYTADNNDNSEQCYYVQEGDSLHLIAYKVFNDITQWRRIAEFNNMIKFRDLKAGTCLQLPPIEL